MDVNNIARLLKSSPKEPFELEIKKYNIQIQKECPHCGHSCERDLGSDYLSYPTVNQKESTYFYCDNCGGEFEIDIILKISILHHH